MLRDNPHQRIGNGFHEKYGTTAQTPDTGTGRWKRPSVKADKLPLLYLTRKVTPADTRHAEHGGIGTFPNAACINFAQDFWITG